WIQAGYSSNYPLAAVDVDACKLANLPKIILRYNELNKLTVDETIAAPKERKQILSKIARNPLPIPAEITAKDIMTATDQLNKMDKVYTEGVVIGDIKILVIREGEG
ncbi:unnamed protein product, partial [marine sediment metagenome]